MRLEPFHKISMRYEDSSWHRPYGRGRCRVNLLAEGPAALGMEPLERFRQGR